MGFHNVLTGEDLHEPSRVRIVNDVQQTLLPGRLVRLDGAVIEGILTVSDLATDGDILVGFVDTIIAAGNEGTVVLFGRLLDVEVENPTTNIIKEGDFVRVNSSSRFEQTNINEGRVGIVLRRGVDTSPTMNVLFNPLGASKAPDPQYMSLNTPNGLFSYPNADILSFGVGETSKRTNAHLLTFLNGGEFAFSEDNDSFGFSGSGLLVDREGAFEFSISDSISIPDIFQFTNSLSPTTVTYSATFNLLIRVQKPDGNSVDIFRVQTPPKSLSFTAGVVGETPVPYNTNLSGNLQPSSSESLGIIVTDFSSKSLTSKIVKLGVGDLITYRYEIVVDRPINNPQGTMIVQYHPAGTTDMDRFFDFVTTIRRIQ